MAGHFKSSDSIPELITSGSYAVVAGGSKGIGFAVASALAKRKYNLVLIARNWNELNAAKNSLQAAHSITVEILQLDLSIAESSQSISDFCQNKNLPVSVLCNIAGLGGVSDFLTLSADDLRFMVSLNISSPVTLVYSMLSILEKNSPSYILNVASMAGFAPIPKKNLYAATKSAIIFFSYSLRHQLKDKNIKVSCLCPGPVFTKDEIKKETLASLGMIGKLMAVDPDRVGEIAVKGALAGRHIIVPGIISQIFSVLLRIVPMRLIAWIYYELGKKGK